MPAAVRSAFDVALWFVDRARLRDERLQPLKLQQLLFVAQAWYAQRNAGRALMPAVFVADELGPLEPNVHAAFALGRPKVESEGALPVAADAVLRSVWRIFGQRPTAELVDLTTATGAYRSALARGRRASIPQPDIAGCLPESLFGDVGEPGPGRMLRTQDGRSVRVAAWSPVAPSTAPR